VVARIALHLVAVQVDREDLVAVAIDLRPRELSKRMALLRDRNFVLLFAGQGVSRRVATTKLLVIGIEQTETCRCHAPTGSGRAVVLLSVDRLTVWRCPHGAGEARLPRFRLDRRSL
jgi:hypothetical protein